MITYLKNMLFFIFIIIVIPLYSQNQIDPDKSSKMGIQLGQQRKYDEAIQEFDKAIDSYNKTAAKVYHNKGWVLELKDDIPGAISAYEEALKRNPKQIHTLERVGYLYFKTGRFAEAVATGEAVISLDPNNQEVVKWLPDAYAMKLKKFQEDLAAKKEDEQAGKEDVKKTEEETKEKEAPKRYIYGTFEFMVRTAYYFREGEEEKGYMYKNTPGLYMNLPEMLNIIVTPLKILVINLEAGNPYLGALSPNLVNHTEKLEGIARLGKYFLGIGFMGNHYKDLFAYGDWRERSRHDYKLGFIFGFEEDNANLLFRLYPRLLLKDGESSSGTTLDADYAEFDYKYKIDKLLSLYSWISARDYYYFNHDIDMSNYWGMYEFGFGLEVGPYKDIIKYITYIKISLDYNARFYLKDIFNEDPYSFANGQGWFGINSDKWFKGDPFSGYRTLSHVLTLRTEEGILDNFFVYQKIIVEIVDRREDHNEFNLVFGVGGYY